MLYFVLLLLPVLPLYASESKQDAPAEQPAISTFPPVISSLPQERISTAPEIVSDYSSNELAAGAVKRNITFFSERIKERFSLWLVRSGKYLELMQEFL